MADLPFPANAGQTNNQQDPRLAELARLRAEIAAKRAEQQRQKDDELAAEVGKLHAANSRISTSELACSQYFLICMTDCLHR